MKTACVIQGNLRSGFELALKRLHESFDVVIISTWDEEQEKISSDKTFNIFNLKPSVPGYSNRNLQRYSTARGIAKARELGCDHVLKWRTDMLPVNFDLCQLIEWAHTSVPAGMSSRLVTCAFRNLSVREDWFSSMPDLFAFGHIDVMEMLWGDQGFDYSKQMNPPEMMIRDIGEDWQDEYGAIWCAESELYSIFKDRLQKYIGKPLSHEKIAKDYMRLFDHKRLGIVWFNQNGGFRPVHQGYEHPWWTEATWFNEEQVRYVDAGYKIERIKDCLRGRLSIFFKLIEKRTQKRLFEDFMCAK